MAILFFFQLMTSSGRCLGLYERWMIDGIIPPAGSSIGPQLGFERKLPKRRVGETVSAGDDHDLRIPDGGPWTMAVLFRTFLRNQELKVIFWRDILEPRQLMKKKPREEPAVEQSVVNPFDEGKGKKLHQHAGKSTRTTSW